MERNAGFEDIKDKIADMKISIDYTDFSRFLRVEQVDNKRMIFDPIRKKLLVLTPEEFVRQLLLQYLIQKKSYNENRIGVEKKVVFNQMPKRCDVLIYNKNMQPFMLIECKAAEVAISLAAFEQIARYNTPLRVPYLLVTNGLDTYCCKMDYEKESFEFLEEIPDYPQ